MNNSIIERLEFETGRLIFKDVRYMLIRPDVLISLQKSIEAELGLEKCIEIMMAAGNMGGSRSSQRFKEAFGYSEREIVEFMCGMGGEIGWGAFSLVELEAESGTMIIEVTDSPYAAVYGLSETPVCHLIRGVMAGLGGGVFEADVRSEETACAAMGAPACRFEVRRQ